MAFSATTLLCLSLFRAATAPVRVLGRAALQVPMSDIASFQLAEIDGKTVLICIRDDAGLSRSFPLYFLTHMMKPSLLRVIGSQIQRVSRWMAQLIRNLLELSLIDSDQFSLRIQALDLSSLAQRVVENYQAWASQKAQTVHLNVEANCVVAADELCMWQVLDNLLNNAIKFSPCERQIWVSVVRRENLIRCLVRNEGLGLSQNDQGKWCHCWWHLLTLSTAGEDSISLGLAIVKQLVELQGGRAWMESVDPQLGSTFIVELPAIHIV